MKKYLATINWNVVAGEPPGGSNHLPVLEIHDPNFTGKGSSGSKKIDLVAYKNNYFLLIELKSKYAFSDVKKLDQLTNSEFWRKSFVKALNAKNIPSDLKLKDLNRYVKFSSLLIKSIGYDVEQKKIPDDFIVFYFSDPANHPNVLFGTNLKQNIRDLF